MAVWAYPWGQCTYYVGDVKRRDLGELGDLGDAKDWAATAKAKGAHVGNSPGLHAAVNFQPGVLGALEFGHVAYVEAVHADGSFDVSEMHFPVLGVVSYRHGLRPAAGIAFIYSPDSPAQEAREMADIVEWNGQQHLVWVDHSGQLKHQYRGANDTSWHENDVPGATGLPVGAPVRVRVFDSPHQVHVVVQKADGTLLHCYQPVGAGTWAVEPH